MSSEPIIDIPDLLAPISDDAPTGIDIRESSDATGLYYTIKDARNAARSNERTRLFDDSGATGIDPEWKVVLKEAPTLLKSESKDLEVATWLLEALVRYHGFKGLSEGFELIDGLITNFWENIYPEPDEDGIETKVAPLTGLNGEGGDGTLLAPLRSIPFTEDTAAGEYSYWQYQQARDISRISDDGERQQRIDATGISQEKIDNAVRETSDVFYTDLLAHIASCLEHFKSLNTKLDEHCGYDAPPASNIRQTMEEIEGAIKHLAGYKIEIPEEEGTGGEEGTEGSTDGGATSGTSQAGGPVQTREQAFKQLEQISQFFKKTEPHSPLSYILAKSVRWGRMSLPELMNELVPDHSAREHFSEITGAVMVEEED